MKKKQKAAKSNGRLIVGALMTGKPLSSRDIADMIFKSDGRKIKVQDISSLLSKISKKEKYELGHFIKKVKVGNGFTYQIVQEALELGEDKVYDLILKSGKDRYTIDQALSEFPALAKYVETGKSKVVSKKGAAKPKAKKAVLPPKIKSPAQAAEKKSEPANILENMENKDLENLAAEVIQKIAELGGLKLKVKVSVELDEEQS